MKLSSRSAAVVRTGISYVGSKPKVEHILGSSFAIFKFRRAS